MRLWSKELRLGHNSFDHSFIGCLCATFLLGIFRLHYFPLGLGLNVSGWSV